MEGNRGLEFTQDDIFAAIGEEGDDRFGRTTLGVMKFAGDLALVGPGIAIAAVMAEFINPDVTPGLQDVYAPFDSITPHQPEASGRGF